MSHLMNNLSSHLSRLLATICVLAMSSCASTYVSTWKAPDATPLELSGAKVAAVVLVKDQTSRRVAEDILAREITARGAQGIAMYTLLPDMAPNEATARPVLEKAGVQGVVVMRPINVDKEIVITPVTQLDPMYRGYWGGYYNYGYGGAWGGPTTIGSDISSNVVVTVETLVYSLKQNKLVWSGKSKTTNPPDVDKFVKTLATSAAKELEAEGLINLKK